MQRGSYSEMLFTEIQGGGRVGGGRNQRIEVPDSLECAGSDICIAALTPLIHVSQGA